MRDITRTADLLADCYRSGSGRDGFVSLEVTPDVAHDTGATVAQARHYWKTVGRPNLFVKVPGTPGGIPAIETLIAEGISVNVTLLFGTSQVAAAAEAYRRGIERRPAQGGSLEGVHSVASVFVSRLDTAVDRELDAKAAAADSAADRERFLSLRGASAVANALEVWEDYRKRFFGPDFEELRRRGARPQWMLWASTGTKNPAYSDIKYVEELAGPDSINTMPRRRSTRSWSTASCAAIGSIRESRRREPRGACSPTRESTWRPTAHGSRRRASSPSRSPSRR